MKLKKKIICGVIVLIFISGMGLYIIENWRSENASVTSSLKEKSNEKNIVLTVSAEPDFGVQANTLEQLTKLAKGGIVYGRVKDVSVCCDDTGTVYSTYLIEVTKTVEGKMDKGEVIKVTDFGGIISADEYFNKQTDPKALELAQQCRGQNNYVNYIFGDAESPKIGGEYVWYLEKGKNENGIKHYTPICSYEGVLTVDKSSNMAEHYTENEKKHKIKLSEIEKVAKEN